MKLNSTKKLKFKMFQVLKLRKNLPQAFWNYFLNIKMRRSDIFSSKGSSL